MSRAERVLATLVTLHFSFGSPSSREEAIPKPQLTFKTSPRSAPRASTGTLAAKSLRELQAVSIARVQFARERLLRALNLSSKHRWGPSLSVVSPCEMLPGFPDGRKDSDVLWASLCPQGRLCKLGFSRPIPSSPALDQSQEEPGLSERVPAGSVL